ncbi:MAG: radical SAM protein, partial [Halobacteriovoraceae bacterium]|nr:radical SAM protein [Halobacteriovoraceae bacterium]
MESLKYFTFFLSLSWLHIRRKRAPIWVNINLTHKCNLSCHYCDLPKDKKDLPSHFWIEKLDQLKEAGTKVIGISGAEPLLHRDIKEIIDYAHEKKFIINLYSNGSFSSSKLPQLKKVDNLFISLDGLQATHDANRGEKSFSKALNGIEITKDHLPLTIICTLTPNNIHDVDNLLNFCQSYKIKVVFQNYVYNLDAKKLSKNSLALITEVFEKLIEKKRAGYPIANSYESLKLIATNTISTSPCLGGKRFCDISADGIVYPCFEDDKREKYAVSLKDKSIQEAFSMFLNTQCSCNNSCGLDTNNILQYELKSIG